MPRSVVFFDGADTAGYRGLWASNGTASGTYEISGFPNDPATGIFNNDPPVFGQYGGRVAFGGYDASGYVAIWLTNGTATGTTEVVGAFGRYTNGLYPTGFAALNGELYFGAQTAFGYQGLFATDGTAAGTHLVTAGPNGNLAPTGLMALNGKVVFGGGDGLWVSDGTAAGTQEILATGAAYDLMPFQGKIAFLAPAPNYNGGFFVNSTALYVTDGTSAGTQLIKFLGGSTDLKTQDSIDNLAFLGAQDYEQDSSGYLSVSTSVITHLPGTNGLFQGTQVFAPLSNSGLTALNGHLLFAGTGNDGVRTLWISDGTDAGTRELAGIAGTYSGGVLDYDKQPAFSTAEAAPGFAVAGTEAYFRGVNAAGQIGLWETDGTAAGTHEISGIAGASPSGIQPLSVTTLQLPTVQGDYTGMGTSGVLLASPSGSVIDWVVGNNAYQSYHEIGNSNGYNVVGSGDFNGDGTADVLLENGIGNGDVATWTLQNGAYQATHEIGNEQAYGVIGTGDFNGDGTSDILLENAGGEVIDWLMQNGAYQSYADVGRASGYGVVGTGDFNGDGTSDVLLENGSGAVIDWMMQGGTYQNYNTVGNASGYGVVGKGDFNGDGTTDILLENGQGNVIDWMMQNGQYAGYHEVGNAAGYGIVATGDYNGDGTTDVLLENSSHQVIDWTMQNGTYAGYTNVGNAGSYGVRNS